jgi:hypothetical protein
MYNLQRFTVVLLICLLSPLHHFEPDEELSLVFADARQV